MLQTDVYSRVSSFGGSEPNCPRRQQDAISLQTQPNLAGASFPHPAADSQIKKQQGDILSHWRYLSRRDAQELVPGLWIGPVSALHDEEFVDRAGLRACISLVDYKASRGGVRFGSNNVTVYRFEPGNSILDSTCLVSVFSQVNRLIDGLLTSHTPTIIVCESGNNKSAAVAAAYVLHSHPTITCVEALQMVQAKRLSINLDEFAVHNLVTFKEILDARRQCERGTFISSRKRRPSDQDDSQEHQLEHKRRS